MTEEQKARLEEMAEWMKRGDAGAEGSILLAASVAQEHSADLSAALATIARLEAERVKDGEALEGAPDGFIAWSGGKNPAPGMRVDAIWLGDLHEDRPSDNLTWEHSDFYEHITAYRLSSRAKDQSQ